MKNLRNITLLLIIAVVSILGCRKNTLISPDIQTSIERGMGYVPDKQSDIDKIEKRVQDTIGTIDKMAGLLNTTRDGVLQLKSAYNVSGNTITFTGTPANNSVVEITTFTGTNLSYYNRTYTGDNTSTTFAATTGVSNASIIVTENGIVQEPGVDYFISGANVVFTTAPSTGVKIGIRELASTAVVSGNIQIAFDQANAAFLQANSAYTKANTSASTGKAIAMAIVFGG